MKKYVEKTQMPEGWYLEFKDLPVHEKIRKCREARGISQDELAARIPIARQHESRLESGKSCPGENIKERIEEVLGLPKGFLSDDEERELLSLLTGFVERYRSTGGTKEELEDHLETILFARERKLARTAG